MALLVSREELEREREELRRLREEYDRKWRRLRGVVANVKRWERRIPELEEELASLKDRLPGVWREYRNLRDIRLPMARGRLYYWREEREAIIVELYRERAIMAAAQQELKRKVLEEWIGDEACSGYDIYYGKKWSEEQRREIGVYRIRNPETHELIREDDKLAVAVTFSVSTGVGHDVPLTLEITSVTYVKEMSLSDLVRAEVDIERSTLNWLRGLTKDAPQDVGWREFLMKGLEKVGVEYNGKTHVEEVKLYPFTVPDYPAVHVILERRSRYLKERTYEGELKIE